MKTLLVVFHSQTGGAAPWAPAAPPGARAQPRVTARLCPAASVGPADLLAADAYLFVTPEYLGTMAGRLKDFFDRSYYPVLERLNGSPYAVLVCAGSDGQGAARQVARIATGWRLKAVAEPLIVCTRAQTPEAILAPKTLPADDLDRCAEVGAALAAGLALGIY